MTRCKNVDHCKGTHPTICEQEGCAREAGELRRQADFNQASAEKYIEYLEADNKAARAQLAAKEQELEKEKAQSQHLAEAMSRKIDELLAAEKQCSYYKLQYTRAEQIRKEACEANVKAQAKMLWQEDALAASQREFQALEAVHEAAVGAGVVWQQECERLREALSKYGKHLPYCNVPAMRSGGCNCGFDAALATGGSHD